MKLVDRRVNGADRRASALYVTKRGRALQDFADSRHASPPWYVQRSAYRSRADEETENRRQPCDSRRSQRFGRPAGREAESEFDVIYAGGAAALLHAATLACAHGRRVLFISVDAEGSDGGNWNLSDVELRGLESSGLFTREEIEASVVNRYRGGFVKFHDASSRVKAEPLWVSGSLDVAVDGGHVVALAAEKLRRRGPKGCAIIEGLRFVRAYVEPSRRPADGRFGENPNRLHQHHQYQVILKPSPKDVQEQYLGSLRAIGINSDDHVLHALALLLDDTWSTGWACLP